MKAPEGRSATESKGLPSEALELGRSMFRFSWAMTVFGAQQAVNLLTIHRTPGEARLAAAGAFDAVAHELAGQFGGVCRGAYEAGKQWLPGFDDKQPGVAGTKG